MRNETWVWPEVGDAGTSGAGAVPLRSAQMMGQQKKKRKKETDSSYSSTALPYILGLKSALTSDSVTSQVRYCNSKPDPDKHTKTYILKQKHTGKFAPYSKGLQAGLKFD